MSNKITDIQWEEIEEITGYSKERINNLKKRGYELIRITPTAKINGYYIENTFELDDQLDMSKAVLAVSNYPEPKPSFFDLYPWQANLYELQPKR